MKKEKNVRADYIKIFALVSIICFIVLQIFANNGGSGMSGGSMSGAPTPASLLNDKNFDILSGINMRGGHPDF